MAKKEKQQYAVAVRVSPKPMVIGNKQTKYKSKTFKGVVIAASRKEIEDLVKEMILLSFKEFDGSTEQRPFVSCNEVTIVKAELYSDFLFKKEKQ